jgi:hypothetical protein
MNTTQNKAALWKSCVEQGIFDNVPSELQHNVQGLFEITVNQFNNEGLDIPLANQLLLKEFKLQLGKMIGKPIPQKSFEEVNEEYKGLYAPKPPEKIEFSQEKDTPIEDIESILKLKSEQRQNEIHEFFKEDQKIGGVIEPVSQTQSFVPQSIPSQSIQTQSIPSQPFSSLPNNRLSQIDSPSRMDELIVHRRILESILKSQIKIIELLQRK